MAAVLACVAGGLQVMHTSAAVWSERTELAVNGASNGGQIGFQTAISADGSTAIVGAINEHTAAGDALGDAGAAYVYVRNGNTWELQATLTPSTKNHHEFGFSLALSADGTVAMVGDPDSVLLGNQMDLAGSVDVFTRSQGVWSEKQELTAGDEAPRGSFGFVVAMNAAGTIALVGSPQAGTTTSVLNADGPGGAYVFVSAAGGASWTQVQKILPADAAAGGGFGASVSLNSNGVLAAITGPTTSTFPGAVYVYAANGATYGLQQEITALVPSDGCTCPGALALSGDGKRLLIGASGQGFATGAAYLFERSGTTWTQRQRLTESNPGNGDIFGSGVALSHDGSTALIAADNTAGGAGQVSVYSLSSDGLDLNQVLFPKNPNTQDRFGRVSLSDDGATALIGARFRNGTGAAYVFGTESATRVTGKAQSAGLGGTTSDDATVTGVPDGPDPTGTVAFTLCYSQAPMPTGCSNTLSGGAVARHVAAGPHAGGIGGGGGGGSVTVTHIGTVDLATGTSGSADDGSPTVRVTSPSELANQAGYYCFLATYSGDVNYLGEADSTVATQCFNTGPMIETTSLSDGTAQLNYNDMLEASGGEAPYTWSISAGALPNGLQLDASTGGIAGTPTKTGKFTFTVKVTDVFSHFDNADLSITISDLQILSIDPTHDTYDGGTTMQVTGKGFGTAGSADEFNFCVSSDCTPATDVSVLSDTHLTLTIPPASDTIAKNFGDTNVYVTAAFDGANVNSNPVRFTYDLRIDSLSASTGSPWGGENLSIHGAGFSAIGADDVIEFCPSNGESIGCSHAENVDVVDDGLLNLTVPSETTFITDAGGPADVKIFFSLADGTDVTSNFVPYSYEMKLNTVDPSSASPWGGNTISLHGSGFGSAGSDDFVQFCPPGDEGTLCIAGTHTTVLSDGELTTEVPEASVLVGLGVAVQVAAGLPDYYVDFPHSNQRPFQYAIQIDGVDPPSGSVWGRDVTLMGAGFGPAGSDDIVAICPAGDESIDCPDATNVKVTGDSMLTATLPSESEAIDVAEGHAALRVIAFPGGDDGGLEYDSNIGMFAYQMRVDSVTPNHGSVWGGGKVTITGTGFGPKGSDDTVRFCGADPSAGCANATNAVVTGDDEITATVPKEFQDIAGTGGDALVDVQANLKDLIVPPLSNQSSFHYDLHIGNVVPALSPPLGGGNVSITGLGFGPPASDDGVLFCPTGRTDTASCAAAPAVTVGSDTQIFATIPPETSAISALNGKTDVYVTAKLDASGPPDMSNSFPFLYGGGTVPLNITTTSVTNGQTLSFNATGFLGGETVAGTVFSTPESVGTFIADSSGTVAGSFIVPADLAPGQHTLTLLGTLSQVKASVKFTVVASTIATISVPNAGSGGALLAATTMTLIGIALVLTAGILRRRKS